MKPTQQLHDLGQSLWLDNITRGLLKSGTLRQYIDELSITGLTSNPSIFYHAIKNSNLYDDDIRRKRAEGKSNSAYCLLVPAGWPFSHFCFTRSRVCWSIRLAPTH